MGLRIQVLATKQWMNATGVLDGKCCFWLGPSSCCLGGSQNSFLSLSSLCSNEGCGFHSEIITLHSKLAKWLKGFKTRGFERDHAQVGLTLICFDKLLLHLYPKKLQKHPTPQ